MVIQRIVSFLPSATELIYELGVQDKIYGVTHECKYPKDAMLKPKVINSVFDSEKLSSAEIDKKTTQLMQEGKEIFKLNQKALLDADPDFIISQATCEVCAAHNNQVEKALKILKKNPIHYSFDAHNIGEILKTIPEISKIIGNEKQGKKLEENLKNRIQKVKEKNYKSKTKILAIEWIDPFFTAGHWIPEMIELAGGLNLISKTGEHSRRIKIEEIQRADPDIIVLMPCGFDTKRTVKEYNKNLKNSKEWNEINAVKEGKVFAVDADSYFSKPSIRTITGIEILGKIIQPKEFSGINVPNSSFLQIT